MHPVLHSQLWPALSGENASQLLSKQMQRLSCRNAARAREFKPKVNCALTSTKYKAEQKGTLNEAQLFLKTKVEKHYVSHFRYFIALNYFHSVTKLKTRSVLNYISKILF